MSKLTIKTLKIAPNNANVAVIIPDIEYDYINTPTNIRVKLLDEKYIFKENACFIKLDANTEQFISGLSDKVLTFNKISDTELYIEIGDEPDFDFISIFLESLLIPTEDTEPEIDAFIISPEFIREQSNISSNIQDKFLQAALREVTDIDYRSLVGTKMLRKLKKLINDESIYNTDNIYYKNLLEYSKYYLVNMVTHRILPICNVKIDNMGAYQTSDEHVEALDTKEMFKMSNYYLQRADYYKKLIQEYMIKVKDMLPEIGELEQSVKANTKSMSSTGIWLGGKRGRIGSPIKYIYNC